MTRAQTPVRATRRASIRHSSACPRAPLAKLYRRPLRSTQAWRCARCATSRVAGRRVRVLVRT